MISFLELKQDLFRLMGATSTTARSDLDTAAETAIARGQREFVNYGAWSFMNQYQGQVYIPLTQYYSTGTVEVTNGSQTITGTGTTWTQDMVGRFFQLDNQEVYEIRGFTSTTVLTLEIPYQGTTDASETYKIHKRFYPLPLDFLRAIGTEAYLMRVGSNSQVWMEYRKSASFSDSFNFFTQPQWFSIQGNTRGTDYYATGTCTIATASGTSTWTISSGTLPTDIVGREIRVLGEEKGYLIATRGGATTLTTVATYVNPADATNTLSTASTYAVTPKETQMLGISGATDQNFSWIFAMPYLKKLPDLIADSDISPISLNGFDGEFIAVCRGKLAEDFRTMIRSQFDATALISEGKQALGNAWSSEQQGETMQAQASGFRRDFRQSRPSWIG